jgi:hypothetical protein
MLRRTLFVVLLLLAPRLGAGQGAGQSAVTAANASGTVIGDVVMLGTGTPLEHAMVTLVGGGRQTFTSDRGVFAFTQLLPGTYHLRVTHLGFTPMLADFVMPATGPAPRVRVELTRVSVRLAAVKISGKPSCSNPGRPDPALNKDLFEVVQQVRLNAEQFQVVSDSFPFSYLVQRARREVRADDARGPSKFDTLHLRSDARGWEYKMGDVVEREGPGRYVMHLPTLRDFAGIDFLNNHCFHYAGLDSTREGVLLRIDFRADDQIRTPDVNGTIYLDPKTYQIRLAELELSKLVAEVRDITAVKVRTIFREISPNIVVFDRVIGTNELRHGWGAWAIAAIEEDQRMMRFEWLQGEPGKVSVP